MPSLKLHSLKLVNSQEVHYQIVKELLPQEGLDSSGNTKYYGLRSICQQAFGKSRDNFPFTNSKYLPSFRGVRDQQCADRIT